MPLTHTNMLIRSAHLDGQGVASLVVLLVYAAGFFAYGSHLIGRYSE
jgi:hypothetical protein